MKNIYRSIWINDFPLVDIYAKERKVKEHLDYDKAKSGNIDSALHLIRDTISPSKMKSLNRYRDLNPIVLPVVGIEGVSDNVIPNAMAVYISETMRFSFNDDIVQTTKAAHTGSDGWWRLLSQAAFEGDVILGGNYILIDDFIGMGGTFANLKGYIESRGGHVIKTVALTGKPRSSTIGLKQATLDKLRSKYGSELELWWQAIFGYGFAELTESEANYLIRTESFDTIRDQIIKAAEQRKQ
jgi:hypothetical protein